MQEKILTNKKNGMLVLVVTVLLLCVELAGVIWGAVLMENNSANFIPFVVFIVLFSISWIPLLGLRVLKPQEALVLTLFGKYIGTLKGDGFYAVNPFCTSVNPAANTELNQSGDVKKVAPVVAASAEGASVSVATSGSKKI